MKEIVAKAVKIYRENPMLENDEMYHRIIAEITDPNIAGQLFELLPLAYTRALLGDIGVKFNESYQRIDKYGQLSPEQPLASIPLWSEIVTYAKSEIKNGVPIKDFLVFVNRSAEYKIILQMKQNGATLSDYIGSPILFADPGADPDDIQRVLQSQARKLKSMKKNWWQFWK